MKVFISATIVLSIVFGSYLTNITMAQSATTPGESNAKDSHVERRSEGEHLFVRKCKDFDVNGMGDNQEWKKTEYTFLTKLDKGGKEYESKFKILYSSTGIYLLFYGQDDQITTQSYQDFDNIFNGDVFEVFFHTNPQVPVYFEYEVNQLDKQLILMISKLNGQHKSWAPWHYTGKNESGIVKMVEVVGGAKELNGQIRSWSAEIFFPYGSLGLLPNVPPMSGTLWNANFCRLDYDSGNMIKWSWTSTIKSSFHELDKFRSIIFE